MEALLLAIYAFFVWLIFFKFKLLPWTTATAVVVITLPIFGLAAMMLLLNVYAPSALDVQVVKYVVQIVPRVSGRVTEVPVEPNRLTRKGDVLFRIDPRPFEYEVQRVQAQLATTTASLAAQREELRAAEAQIAVSLNRVTSIESSTEATRVRLKLAELRLSQTQQLAAAGAGDQFEAQRWESDVAQHRADLGALLPQFAAAQQEVTVYRAKSASLRERLNAIADGEQADVAQVRAQLRDAQWKLEQTTTYAPDDGYVINLQLRPGSTVTQLPMLPVMSFVEEEFVIIALFNQNELHKVEPGNDAEITLSTYPSRIIKAKVDSIIWAQGQGQSAVSGNLPNTAGPPPPAGRFPVKLTVEPKFRDVFFAAGARGDAAIYTDSLEMIHIIRKVILRINTKINYLILKLH
jgi:multidrug resistance efflux pump